MEIWKDIKGYENYYQISNFGNVKSLERIIIRPKKVGSFMQKERILSNNIDKSGYSSVLLVKETVKKKMLVHRLVAKAFIRNKDNHKYVNHIDANRSNNLQINLEWCTQSENKKHSYNLGLSDKKGEKHHLAKFKEKDIIDIRNKYDTGNFTQKEISETYNVSKSTIWHIVNYKTWNYDFKKIRE